MDPCVHPRQQGWASDLFPITSPLIKPPLGHFSHKNSVSKERHSAGRTRGSLRDRDDMDETEAEGTRSEVGEAEGGKK